jgi:AraC family transcriptional regulator
MQHYRHPPCRIAVPALSHNLLIIHRTGPYFIEDMAPMASPQSGWTEQGRISFTSAGDAIVRNLKGQSDSFCIHLSREIVATTADQVYREKARAVRILPRLAVQDSNLSRLGEVFGTEAGIDAPDKDLMLETMGRAVVLHLLRRHSTYTGLPPDRSKCSHDRRLMKAAEYMREHIDESLPLQELAKVAGLSAAQFLRSFSRSVGEPPHRYLTKLRMHRARELLSRTNLRITDIALQCGFEQPAHFATMFRQLNGVSPRVWRNVHRT